MKYITGNCPCCGAELKAELTISLSPQQIEILNLLRQRPGKIYSTDDISNHLYSHDPNGGPITASSVIHKQIFHIRQKLGKDIIKNIGNRGYRINVVENPQ